MPTRTIRKDQLVVLVPLNEQDPMTDLPAAGRIQAEPAIKGRTIELRGSSQQVVILQRTGMSHALLEDQTRRKTPGGAVFRLASELLLKIAHKPDSVRPNVGGEICLSLPLAGSNDSPRSAAKLVMENMDPLPRRRRRPESKQASVGAPA